MNADPFLVAFRGSFIGILRWQQLDDFWDVMRQHADENWYIYALGESPPDEPVAPDKLAEFIREIDTLLRAEHDEDYCGIVYVDDKQRPSFVKIFDPNNLGVSCGFSEIPPLPGWIISKLKPAELSSRTLVPQSRKRWWQRLFSTE